MKEQGQLVCEAAWGWLSYPQCNPQDQAGARQCLSLVCGQISSSWISFEETCPGREQQV